ncbi:uncharacterized protein LAESUDRAFT_758872 [Laetiporus sulphureus 93-53]|uniref:Arrestin-like N-terminal domain-containing protein n=1 Tax=Laetiporus sulphureus 93-53 TaxID=1314785 RepID=A0A165EHF6_9APHY|nr:uncharacterized protein LAESUDRAFT_758872 [Laetiporus sulphureus 93-53]KZT07059.1 hypothetical protein LAESUDRAFT_758872 [Laetiporus sulphureus 93-53]
MPPPSVTIYISRAGFLAGEVVYGTVELNFRALEEERVKEVRVKLRGHAATALKHSDDEESQTADFICLDQSLWMPGTHYPPPESDFLSIPTAPLSPLSAITSKRSGYGQACSRGTGEASVPSSYIFTPDEAGSLRIRRAFWGDYGDVQLELKRPSAIIYPVLSDILFVITIATIGKPIKLKDNKKPWPSPPLEPSAVHFELKRIFRVQVKEWSDTSTGILTSLGGMGGSYASVSIETKEDQWLPDDEDKNKGRWRKEVSFSSSFRLKHTPTFSSPLITLEYFLHVRVHFGGLRNSLSMDIPITVGSGVAPLTGDAARDNQSDEALPRFEDLDIPPLYWNTKHILAVKEK